MFRKSLITQVLNFFSTSVLALSIALPAQVFAGQASPKRAGDQWLEAMMFAGPTELKAAADAVNRRGMRIEDLERAMIDQYSSPQDKAYFWNVVRGNKSDMHPKVTVHGHTLTFKLEGSNPVEISEINYLYHYAKINGVAIRLDGYASLQEFTEAVERALRSSSNRSVSSQALNFLEPDAEAFWPLFFIAFGLGCLFHAYIWPMLFPSASAAPTQPGLVSAGAGLGMTPQSVAVSAPSGATAASGAVVPVPVGPTGAAQASSPGCLAGLAPGTPRDPVADLQSIDATCNQERGPSADLDNPQTQTLKCLRALHDKYPELEQLHAPIDLHDGPSAQKTINNIRPADCPNFVKTNEALIPADIRATMAADEQGKIQSFCSEGTNVVSCVMYFKNPVTQQVMPPAGGADAPSGGPIQ